MHSVFPISFIAKSLFSRWMFFLEERDLTFLRWSRSFKFLCKSFNFYTKHYHKEIINKIINKITRKLFFFFCKENKRCYYYITLYTKFIILDFIENLYTKIIELYIPSIWWKNINLIKKLDISRMFSLFLLLLSRNYIDK